MQYITGLLCVGLTAAFSGAPNLGKPFPIGYADDHVGDLPFYGETASIGADDPYRDIATAFSSPVFPWYVSSGYDARTSPAGYTDNGEYYGGGVASYAATNGGFGDAPIGHEVRGSGYDGLPADHAISSGFCPSTGHSHSNFGASPAIYASRSNEVVNYAQSRDYGASPEGTHVLSPIEFVQHGGQAEGDSGQIRSSSGLSGKNGPDFRGGRDQQLSATGTSGTNSSSGTEINRHKTFAPSGIQPSGEAMPGPAVASMIRSNASSSKHHVSSSGRTASEALHSSEKQHNQHLTAGQGLKNIFKPYRAPAAEGLKTNQEKLQKRLTDQQRDSLIVRPSEIKMLRRRRGKKGEMKKSDESHKNQTIEHSLNTKSMINKT